MLDFYLFIYLKASGFQTLTLEYQSWFQNCALQIQPAPLQPGGAAVGARARVRVERGHLLDGRGARASRDAAVVPGARVPVGLVDVRFRRAGRVPGRAEVGAVRAYHSLTSFHVPLLFKPHLNCLSIFTTTSDHVNCRS